MQGGTLSVFPIANGADSAFFLFAKEAEALRTDGGGMEKISYFGLFRFCACFPPLFSLSSRPEK